MACLLKDNSPHFLSGGVDSFGNNQPKPEKLPATDGDRWAQIWKGFMGELLKMIGGQGSPKTVD
jgi:hypothetical protein